MEIHYIRSHYQLLSKLNHLAEGRLGTNRNKLDLSHVQKYNWGNTSISLTHVITIYYKRSEVEEIIEGI